MERKLATIRKIKELNPIEGADKIEVATIDGWQAVTRKGEFKVEDFCVFFEIDSILPRKEWNEFLFRDSKEKFRLKTIRLKGQISQGLALPLIAIRSYFVEPDGDNIRFESLQEFDDVTELLGVTKYEPYIPVQLQGLVKGAFPSFLGKTDEERIQNVTFILDKYYDTPVYITEKVDGCSMTVYLNENEFGVCSRNLDLKETEENAYWKMARQLDIENKMRELTEQAEISNFAIQGELYGEGIQGNKYNIKGQRFAVFNIYDIDTGEYLNFSHLIDVTEDLGLENVPYVGIFTMRFKTVEEIVNFAKRKSLLNPDIWAEGNVIRPLKETVEIKLGRLSFKVINVNFLLDYNE